MTWWELLHPDATHDMLGYLPLMLAESDPRKAMAQFNDRYRYGGGWKPFHGFTFDNVTMKLTYPGDPPCRALGRTHLRDETIILFERSWVAIVQPDGSYEIARID